MSMDARDTRDAAARPRTRIGWPVLAPGETAELRIFLEDVLQIPKHARRFSVTFAYGEALVVSVDYLPREIGMTPEDQP